jgi:glycosyltransferase involved in cell wall biosynthesis
MRRVLGGAVRRTARLLPPPRDAAFVDLARDVARDVRDLVTGSEPVVPGTRRREPRVDYARISRAESALANGDFDRAISEADAILEAEPESVRALMTKRLALTRRGDLVETLATMHRMRRLRDDRSWGLFERRLLGKVLETDPTWSPRIPGPPRPVEPRGEGVVLHLLKESLPYRQTGFTVRSRYNLLAQIGVGMEPVVVTQPGFPRDRGITDAPEREVVDGIVHYRIDPGPGYPADPPVDLLLSDYAWLAARIAARERPALVSASSGHRGYESALVGLALREHLHVPMVYEVRSFFEATWGSTPDRTEGREQYVRRDATEVRCMLAADAVITIADAMRDDIVARGVPADRVFVVPNGVDPVAFAPIEPDPAVRHRWGLEGMRTFGYVSNLDHPREGQEVLIRAMARLARGRGDLRCLVIGDGARREELERLANGLGVGQRVIFTGRVPHDEVRQLYELIDVFVVPRIDERAARLVTPLKPFEAMALGRPIVVSDLPALVEIAPPGERGLSFPPGDADALASSVARLLDDPQLARRLAEAGREWVVRERTWAGNGPRFREAYAAAAARFTEREAGRRSHRGAARTMSRRPTSLQATDR